MKKVTTVFDKQLQKLLATDEEFKRIPVLRHALAITNFVVELSATGIVPPPQFPILNCDFNVPEAIRLTDSELKLFVEAYKSAGRIQAYIQPGSIDMCLIVNIIFYGPGQGNSQILFVHAGADSMAVRKFNVDRPTLAELQHLYDEGRREREKRNAKEAETRSLTHIGP